MMFPPTLEKGLRIHYCAIIFHVSNPILGSFFFCSQNRKSVCASSRNRPAYSPRGVCTQQLKHPPLHRRRSWNYCRLLRPKSDRKKLRYVLRLQARSVYAWYYCACFGPGDSSRFLPPLLVSAGGRGGLENPSWSLPVTHTRGKLLLLDGPKRSANSHQIM